MKKDVIKLNTSKIKVNFSHINTNMKSYGIDNISKGVASEGFALDALRNNIIKKGKKATADKLLNITFMLLRSSGVYNPLTLLASAVRVLRPLIETRPLKRGSQIIQVPSMIKQSRQYMLAIHWLVSAAKHRANKHDSGMHGLAYGIAQELRAICLDSMLPSKMIVYSEAIAKRNILHKNANSHRVNMHIIKKFK